MECLVLSPCAAVCTTWQWRLEDYGESWRCRCAHTAGQALTLMRRRRLDLVILTDTREAGLLTGLLSAAPLLAPPYLLGDGVPAPDGPCPQMLPAALALWQQTGRLPVLSDAGMPVCTRLAGALLHQLGAPERLRAWRFLPDMIALTVVHPPLLQDLAHRLYPLTAARHGMTPAAVERSLRLLVESTWSRGSLNALERFFGSSVDPERGKPTNREFLCRVQEQVTQGAARLGSPGGFTCTSIPAGTSVSGPVPGA